MANILVISPTPSHPQNAGNRARIFSLLTSLKFAGHRVHFVFVKMEEGDGVQMAREWDGYFEIPFKLPRMWRKRILEKWAGLFRLHKVVPFKIDDWYDPRISSYLKEIRDRVKPDVVLVEYTYLSKAFKCFGNQYLKILDTHDILGDRLQLFFALGLRPDFFYTTPAEEKKGLDRADIILAIQDNETKYFQQFTSKTVLTVGHLATIPEAADEKIDFNAPRLLFIGSVNQPNLHGLSWFIKDVLPLVRNKIPGIELEIVGACAGSFQATEGVILTGPVSDLGPIYRRAAVVINPVRFGTGLKIKTIEALAHGRPLVTTSAGASGLESWRGRAFIVAESADKFAEEIMLLWMNQERRLQLSSEARRLVHEYNQNIFDPLKRQIEAEISRRLK